MKHLQVEIYMNGKNRLGGGANLFQFSFLKAEKCSFVLMTSFFNPEATAIHNQVIGTFCRIASIRSARLTLFLSEFGIMPGTTLRVVAKMPGKGPVALEAGDFKFCIRYEDADCIAVESIV